MKVKLTIAESKCRSGYFKAGGEFIVEDLCPPRCATSCGMSFILMCLHYKMALTWTVDATEIFSLMLNVLMGQSVYSW